MALATTHQPLTLETARERLSRDALAVWIGYQLDELERGRVCARMTVDPKHIAPNGYLHASVSIALADITCGYGSGVLLAEGESLTTIELKSNHLGTALAGVLRCTATARHIGGRTHVWDAEVLSETTGKAIMLFRCTQMVLQKK